MNNLKKKKNCIQKRSMGLFNLFMLYVSCFMFLFLTGCSKINNETTYKIAVAAPQFGPYKASGISLVHGAELAVDIKNKNGGIDGKQIKLISVDDGGLAGEATWRAKNLIQEMVLGVIGHVNSDISIPASEIYAMAMIAEISPASTSPLFTERPEVQGYVFRTIGRDDQQGELAANFVAKNGFKKIAIIYSNRSYGLSLASEFIQKIEELSNDIKIVLSKTYRVGTDDYLREIDPIKQKSPDLIFFVGEYEDAAKFLKRAKSVGITAQFLGGEAFFDPDFISITKGINEGIKVIGTREVKNEAFIKNYKDRFKKNIGAYSVTAFDAANVLISAIENVKENDSEKISKAIQNTKDFPGLTGTLSFDSKGDLINPQFLIYEIKNGLFVETK